MIREDSVRIPFRYAAGEVASRFLTALRDEGRILGARCPTCARVSCPARPFCARCGGATSDLVDVGPAGTLESWTALGDGRVYGLVRLDGADGAMVHRLLDAGTPWRLGARVRAVFEAASRERTGSIQDLAGFALLVEETP